MKTVFMFSGQGAQYVGMGKELYENYEEARKVFDQADSILEYSIKDIMFNNEEKLNDTLYTQVAMFTFYYAILEVLKSHSINAEYSIGLSLGEYGALLHNDVKNVKGYVKIANYNTYGQLVISGEEKAVLEVNKLALESGAKRAILLNTSGPFHTDLMVEASRKLKEYLGHVDLDVPKHKLLVNVTGDFYQGNAKEW